MKTIMMNPADLEVLNKIVKENNITGNFELAYTPGSIGYTIDFIYNNKVIPVCTEANW